MRYAFLESRELSRPVHSWKLALCGLGAYFE